MTHTPPPTPPHRRDGFTLMELLVTISIIALLLGIGVAAMSGAMRVMSRSNTVALLNQLNGVMTEYHAQTGGAPLTHDGDINTFVIEIMELGDGNPAEQMLRNIEERFWNERYRYDLTNDTIAIIDAWGNEIEFFDLDGDNGGSGADQVTNQPARPASARPYFGSAGPDGEWGSFTDGDPNQPTPEAEDNLYSFQLD